MGITHLHDCLHTAVARSSATTVIPDKHKLLLLLLLRLLLDMPDAPTLTQRNHCVAIEWHPHLLPVEAKISPVANNLQEAGQACHLRLLISKMDVEQARRISSVKASWQLSHL